MTHNKYKLDFSYSVGVIRSSSGSKYQTLTGNKNKEDSNCKDSNSVSGPFVKNKKYNMGKEKAYEIIKVPGKGRGVVATRILEVGDLVFSEKTFLKLDNSLAKDVSVFENLGPLVKEKLRRLSHPGGDMDQDPHNSLSLQKKFRINRIDVPEGSRFSAVFEDISMINHSCVPNVFWFWKDDEETLEIRVLKKIAEGEEIVSTYIHLHSGNPFPLRHQRREMLQPWGFVCRYIKVGTEHIQAL